MNQQKRLLSIFLVVFIDLLGFSLILPLLPYYAETFGASSLAVGLLVAVYAAAQMISAPLLGRLSDQYGRRPVLIISIAGNIIGFLILAAANSLWMLFLARLLAGFTGGNISVAQAYITDVTDENNRAKGLGMIGAAFGLGFIIGPAAGGILSQFGFYVPALLAAGLGMANLILVLFWLPESMTAERRQQLASLPRPAFNFTALMQALRRPKVGPLLHTRFFFGLAFSMFQGVFTLYALQRFLLDSTQTGYILAYVGFLSALTQGLIVGRLTRRFSDRQIILWSTVVMALGLLMWAFSPSVWFLLFDLIPIAVAGGTLNTILNAALTKSVTPVEIGGTLGLSSSVESLTRVIAPSIGGLLLDTVTTSGPGIFSALLLVYLAWYIRRNVQAEGLPAAARQVV